MSSVKASEHPRELFRWIILGALLLLLGWLKLSHSVGAGPYGLDASYYFQIARNVAEGQGLVTNVSLYHVGLTDLPQRTGIYPLWPLVLGITGRFIGLVNAVDLLPRVLYLIDLILLYFLVNRLSLRVWGKTALLQSKWSPDLGHLFVLVLGLNPIFFASTTHPYTEGLAFALAFAAFLLLDLTIDRDMPVPWASMAGVAAGLAFLARTQMIILVAAGTLALLAVAIRNRRFIPAALAYGLIGSASYLWWRSMFLVASREHRDPQVGSFDSWVRSDSWFMWAGERAQGILVGFDIGSPHSYVALFGPAALLVPIAAALALWRWVRVRRETPTAPEPSSLLLIAMILSGILFYLTLTLYHATFFRPWLFGWRHGLPYLFLLIPAIAYLLFRSSRIGRGACLAVVLVSVLIAVPRTHGFVTAPPPNGPTPAEAALVGWLNRQEVLPTLLTTHAQTLSVMVDAPIHWAFCSDPPEQTRRMLERLPIDYVLVYGGERQCSFAEYSALRDLLTVSGRFGEGPESILLLGRRDH